ncbi:MAG: virginiamycin B lyase family protein [Candidatus Binatia bacterium]
MRHQKKILPAIALFLVTVSGSGEKLYANGADSFVSFRPGAREIKGKFTVYDLPLDYAAPHCLAADSQGNIWYVAIGANRVGRFDPEKKEFTEYLIPTPESQPHGITVDRDGIAWFTEAGKDKIGRLDPKSGMITEYPVPPGGKREGARGGVGRIHTPMMGKDGYLYATNEWLSTIVKLDPKSGQTWEFSTDTKRSRPYGIQVDLDGNVWFAAVGSEFVGKLDPKSGAITEHKTPTANSGPRRLTMDPDGKIWYAEWNAHKIGYLNPKTMEMKEFIPPSHPQSGTYALASDGAGNLYVAEFISNQVSRFEPKTGKWTEWPMPLRRSRVRNIVVDPKGYVWYADNGNSKLVRLE